MRLACLFLKSRRTAFTTIYLAGIVAFVAGLRAFIRESNVLGSDLDELLVPFALFFVPLGLALMVGIATHGPFGELECTASHSLPALRLGHLVVLLLYGAASLWLLSLTLEGNVVWIFLRNLAGFAGLALLSAPIFGGRLSWVLPLAYGITAFWIGASSESPVWVWPMRPADNTLALTIALALFSTGLSTAVLFGARDAPGETE